MEDMLFVDYIGTFGMPNRNNRVYDVNLVEREIKKIADRLAKEKTINPWAENAVTTIQTTIVTCKQA